MKEVSLKKLVLISTPNKLTNVISDFSKYLKIPDKVKREMYKLIEQCYNTNPKEIESAVMGQRMKVDDILVIHDRYDSTLPFYHSLEIAHFIGKSGLLETENLGHNRILKHPEVISRVQKFLSS